MIEQHSTHFLAIKKSGLFDSEWYLQAYPDVASSGLHPIEHYLRIGARLQREPSPSFDSKLYLLQNPEAAKTGINPLVHLVLQHEDGEPNRVALVEGQQQPEGIIYFDEAYYLKQNRDVADHCKTGEDHFQNYGYKELRNPCANFDVWWYAQNYLLGTPDQGTNPLDHYNTVGLELGYLPTPPVPVTFNPRFSKPLAPSPRRICLFAGYDPDGLVDDYVLDYLRDLAKHADIYYLADCSMDSSEMAKLDGLVKKAWARRHGMYDFGSYSILARDLVGWGTIETYDELIFANDSCYLVHPLEKTFKTMAERDCAWWGLQATKGLASTMQQNSIPRNKPISIQDIKKEHLSSFELDKIYDFLVGSYFLAFRGDVIKDPDFRRVLNNVDEEASKRKIIRKYEVGITRFLIGKGYEFDTLVDNVSKEQPVYTMRAFDLIDDGFPVLKRYFLIHNHYRQQNLGQWKHRIQQANPNVDVSIFEKNLYRVGDAKKLYDNFRINSGPKRVRPRRSFIRMRLEDLSSPKYDTWWAFPVCSDSHLFSDNSRAVFEQVKNDPAIKKIILTRSAQIEVGGVNVEIVPLHSYEGQSFLLRSRHVFLHHGVNSNIEYQLSDKLHNFYNLRHGVPLKRIGYTSPVLSGSVEYVVKEYKRFKSVIAASDVDRLAMTAASWPLTFHDIWVTGFPRHDFILSEEHELPGDFRPRIARLRNQLRGKKFILFAPTFRADQKEGYYHFSESEVRVLADWLAQNSMVMGIRERVVDETRLYSSQLQGESFFDVSERNFPDIELLYREADLLLTDYSSCFIDFMLTKRPVISFAYHQDSYTHDQRGLFCDHELVFPGPICTNFSDLMQALEKSTIPDSNVEQAIYNLKMKFFHNYADTNNSKRVVQRVKNTYRALKPSLGTELMELDNVNLVDNVMSSRFSILDRNIVFNTIDLLCKLFWKYRDTSVRVTNLIIRHVRRLLEQ